MARPIVLCCATGIVRFAKIGRPAVFPSKMSTDGAPVNDSVKMPCFISLVGTVLVMVRPCRTLLIW